VAGDLPHSHRIGSEFVLSDAWATIPAAAAGGVLRPRGRGGGEFDNLPGAGKPLPGANRPHDEQWWIKDYLRREKLTTESMLPESRPKPEPAPVVVEPVRRTRWWHRFRR
jgi:hypothetical protein